MISFKDMNFGKYKICIQAKMTKKPYLRMDRNYEMLELVHSDVYELNGVLTKGGNRYFIIFIDDCS